MSSFKLYIRYFHPKYWLAWIGIIFLFLGTLLPYRVILFLGTNIGRLSSLFIKSRGDIARRNFELCFPNLSAVEIDKKVMENFESTGIAIFEMGMAWFWSPSRIKKHLTITGFEHVEKAVKENKGIIFLGAHFLTLEMGARSLGLVKPCTAVYRKHTNKLWNSLVYWGRMHEHDAMIDRQDIKGMIKVLRNKKALWYAPDHDYGKYRSSVFAPFFEVENACTVSGTSTLARVKDSCVIPVFAKRLPGVEGYELIFYPELNNFPSKDLVEDTKVTNKVIEKMILECDTQYMWMHKRFKTRPDGEESFYK